MPAESSAGVGMKGGGTVIKEGARVSDCDS